MKTISLDFDRIISTNEILNISEENYYNIIKYVTLQTGKFDRKYDSKFYSFVPYIYERNNGNEITNYNKYEYEENKEKVTEYLKNTDHMLLRNLNSKERELIICNYFILKDDIFIYVLEKAIEASSYNSINELYEQINYLCELRNNDPKKFKFLLPRIKLDEKLIPIIQTFINLYNIDDINIILNKLNEYITKTNYCNNVKNKITKTIKK